MTGPSISEQREAVEQEADLADAVLIGLCRAGASDAPIAKASRGVVTIRAAAETLAVVEWMQRLNPAAWAREVTLYKRAQAELAAMDKQEGRSDG